VYEWVAVFGYLGEISQAALLALEITLLAFALAVFLGIVGAVGRNSRFSLLRFVASVYIEVTRNTPVLLQIFVAYFALPSLGLNLNSFEAGVLALGVNIGAYLAEVFRAGISSVPKGHVEAAEILGLPNAQIFIFIVFPQALRNVYPAVVNYLVQILLGTSLLSAIALPELIGTATTINSRTLIFIPIFTVTVIVYLLLSNILSAVAGVIGRVAFKPALVLPRTSVLARLMVRRTKPVTEGAIK